MTPRSGILLLLTPALLALAAPALQAVENPLPTIAQIEKLVDAGQYRDALKPIFRLLALKGSAAGPYDRYELLMLRAECQLQLRDRSHALASLDLARQEAFAQDKPARAAEPTALAYLIEHATAYQYKPKSGGKPIPILDRTLRPAAYAALFADEIPAAKTKIHAINNTKSLAPVLEAARLAGAMRALEIVSKPGSEKGDLETAPLTALVTTNADRLMLPAIDDLNRTSDTISNTANQIIHTQVGHYDPISKKSWMEPVTRRRGPSDQEVQTLQKIAGACDKLHTASVDLAIALASDFTAYKEIIEKAAAAKQKAANILSQDYTVVPP